MEETINLQNPWWFGETLDTGYKRENYTKQIIKQISKNILFILGPRRVGKTFIIFQTIYELIQKGTKPQDICYLSLDNSTISTIDLMGYITQNS
ncbi:AAA family ATPase, partial [Candidatus Dojkabacteria bacterium]|nr:AAA family ATPase [Candidatus Dojkabacteria bacterium]